MVDVTETDKVLSLRPELYANIAKAVTDPLNRAIDTVIRIADELNVPVAVIAPDEKSEPLTFVSESAYENRTWMIGALEEAKEEVKYPVLLEIEDGDEGPEE